MNIFKNANLHLLDHFQKHDQQVFCHSIGVACYSLEWLPNHCVLQEQVIKKFITFVLNLDTAKGCFENGGKQFGQTGNFTHSNTFLPPYVFYQGDAVA